VQHARAPRCCASSQPAAGGPATLAAAALSCRCHAPLAARLPTPACLQDAHEFLNYLLNQVCEGLEKQQKEQAQQRPGAPAGSNGGAAGQEQQRGQGQQGGGSTWLHDIFQGRLVSETRCLQCETITSREEVFVDLSLEIDQNCSLTSCLKQFRCGPAALAATPAA
jgi:hypothetical protein